jgi:phosphoglycerol transferase MdoB-like AlkP superfamily enzyme
MLDKKITLAGIFFSILLSFNVMYFFVYFSLLDLPFSMLHLFYITITTLSFFLLVNFLRWKSWQFLCYLVLLGFYASSLLNFAYFKVFYVFIEPSFHQMQQLDGTMISFLKDFVYLVPTKLFVLAGIVFFGSITNLIIYFVLSTKSKEKLLFNFSALQLISRTQKRSVKQILAIVILFCLINLAAFGTSSYLYNNPKDSWWDIQNQLSDLGFLGHFYSQVYAQTKDVEYEDSSISPLVRSQNTYEQLKKYTGVEASGLELPTFKEQPNILIVQLESTGSWAVENDPSPMPYLKQLMEDNVSIENFHANSCETINAEFSSLCSFWPNSTEPISYSHTNNDYECLPEILKENYNYSTHFFHANTTDFWSRDILNPKWGYDNIYQVPFFKQKRDDIEMLKRTIRELHKAPKPFFAYAVTFSAHSPHNQEFIDYHKDGNGVDIYPFAEHLNPWMINSSEITEEEIRIFFGFLKVTDDGLRTMMEEMKNLKMLDDTIIFIYNDHRYYSFNGSDKLLKFNAYNRMPFVMILPEKMKAEWHSVASHIDIAPTILNMIDQENYQKPEHFVGQSLFDSSYSPVALNKCLGRVYFTNPDLVVEGSAKTNVYSVIKDTDDLLEVQKQNWLSLIKRLIKQSDETLYDNGLLGD